ncbi:DUF192 domain-containing protein [Halobacteriales archaeon QS_9_67_17]|nr:MAG: DUF192 domain-containing protein [Halobacteriales archaeon QS_9_67_17]
MSRPDETWSVRVVHEPQSASDDERRVVASEVELAGSAFARARGLMFRRSVPDDYALVFHFDEQATRRLHMIFVPFDIDAVWVADGVVQQTERLSAGTGRDRAVADTVIELPAEAAADVQTGDRVWIDD